MAAPCGRLLVDGEDRPAVFSPGRLIVPHAIRHLLAVAFGLDDGGINPQAYQVVAHGKRTPFAKREVVFAAAALIGMAFHDNPIALALAQIVGYLLALAGFLGIHLRAVVGEIDRWEQTAITILRQVQVVAGERDIGADNARASPGIHLIGILGLTTPD